MFDQMRRSLSIGLIVMGIFAGASILGAEESSAYEEFSHGLGFSGGEISGIGLSYRQWFGRLGYQAVAGGYYLPTVNDVPGVSSMDYWAGLEGFYRVYANQFSDWFYSQLYLFLGGNHHGSIAPVYSPYVDANGNPVAPTPGVYAAEFIFGGGIGIEAGLFQHISVVFEIGYALSVPIFRVELAPQAAIQYRF